MAFKRFGPKHRPETVTALCDAMLTDRDDLVRTHAALALTGVAFDDRAAARRDVPALGRVLGVKAARVNAALALANLDQDANPVVPDVLRVRVRVAVPGRLDEARHHGLVPIDRFTTKALLPNPAASRGFVSPPGVSFRARSCRTIFARGLWRSRRRNGIGRLRCGLLPFVV
jgi:hypothetical protein